MSGTQDPKVLLDNDSFKTNELQQEHVLKYQLDPCEEDMNSEWQEVRPAVKLSRRLRPYFTVRSCYSAVLQV